MKALSILLMYSLLILLGSTSCKIQYSNTRSTTHSDRPIAFPGAEGFGKYTTGGRGGKVILVTHLEDDGPGSFRKAAAATGKRIIVFKVSGTIHLKSRVNLKGDVTIAGQTAPGDGICIADHPVYLAGDNAIIRYMRFRLGDRYQNLGKVDGSGDDDAFSVSRRKHVIVDHCSISWSTDEAFSAYGGDSTTLQWNIISEPLNYSYHFEKGDTDFQKHGYGGIWGGQHLTATKNLIAHCVSRTPRFNGVRLGAKQEFVDFSNNVIYNWVHNNVYGGEEGTYNIINNYYKPGPNTLKAVLNRIVNPSRTENQGFGKFYVSGNIVEGSNDVSNDNKLGVHIDKKYTGSIKDTVLLNAPLPAIGTNLVSALQAYNQVLLLAGASFRRDTLDARIVKDVRDGTGRIIDVQGGYLHGTDYYKTVNAWPYLKSVQASSDSDNDGMPDDWELKQGLNPYDPSDASQNKIHQSYTNIEMYINSIITI